MAYSELIKNFKNIRNYMRAFYVYGFKSRVEYNEKSARSYDNERRRVESWLGEYMSFRQNACAKQVFISVDSRNITSNPLYQGFKAKSFTKTDVMLHFYILAILANGEAVSVFNVVEGIEKYLESFAKVNEIDESTIRKKLKEYEKLGLIYSEKKGRELWYYTKENKVDIKGIKEMVYFFAQVAPLGVIGSYIMDKADNTQPYFAFKHNYILHALDSEVFIAILEGIEKKCFIYLNLGKKKHEKIPPHLVFPLKIYISTQTGRQYLLAYSKRNSRMTFFRLDTIQEVSLGELADNYQVYHNSYETFAKALWGVSIGTTKRVEHIEMAIHVGYREEHIVQRLEREKRGGTVEKIEEDTYVFSANVYDAMELLPWVRTFIGRIVGLECSNQAFMSIFKEDLIAMQKMYKGDGSDIS